MNDAIFRAGLIELLEGGNAHVTAEQALAGLKAELRNVRPAAELHSVWEELEHMRIAQEDILRYTLLASWKSPEWPDGYWPAKTESVTEDMWSTAVNRFFADLKEVVRLVEDTALDLTAQIPHAKGHTYLRELFLVADHNAYHLGQIVQIRKMLGDWPG